MKIITGKLIIVEQCRFQKRHYDNTRAVKAMNTPPSVNLKAFDKGVWNVVYSIQALRTDFRENVPEEVFQA